MLKVRISVINSTFDGDHAATECWSPVSVSESGMITPTFWLFRTLRGDEPWRLVGLAAVGAAVGKDEARDRAFFREGHLADGRLARQPTSASTQSAEEPTFWT